ncbi:type I-E CRISPR-associated endoribonuclease Cas2e [Streptomyces violaceusniger]|uniref:type I-E CRISPR-associated endoribonuclease Cas2e n=1 Tax=Streptomyces violaceusniger TaxID=68280 RepID=UPI0009980FDD|nr:type I-E CRISPR-associated endoribonuclease Cas2e [Streptomyces violaceusniger]
MASMITIAASAVPDHLRGALTRWLLEVTPQLYVGTVSARVRDELWSTVTACTADGVAVLVYPADNEQGFELRTAGQQRRRPIDFEGLTLVAFGSLQPDPLSNSQGMANRF